MDGIDTFLRRYPHSPVVEGVLGTLDADAIRAPVRELEPETVEVFYFAGSGGALFGVRRRDGSRAAIKVNELSDGHLHQRARIPRARRENRRRRRAAPGLGTSCHTSPTVPGTDRGLL